MIIKNVKICEKRGSWAIVQGVPKKGQKWAKIGGPRKVPKIVFFSKKMMKNGTEWKLWQKYKKSCQKLKFFTLDPIF